MILFAYGSNLFHLQSPQLLLFYIISQAAGADPSEESCKHPTLFKNYNPRWVSPYSSQYIVLTSKVHFRLQLENLYGKEVAEQLFEKKIPCLQIMMDPYGNWKVGDKQTGKQYLQLMRLNKGALYSWDLVPSETGKGIGAGGKVSISLSDNASFSVHIFCHDDGLGSFTVASPYKSLGKETLRLIKGHLLSLGFKREQFFEPNNHVACVGAAAPAPPLAGEVGNKSRAAAGRNLRVADADVEGFEQVLVGNLKNAQIDFSLMKEPCAAPFVSKNVDPNWETKVGVNATLYPVLTNRAYLTRITQQLFKTEEFADLREAHFQSACIRVQKFLGGMVVEGYRDKVATVYLAPDGEGGWTFTPTFPTGVGGTLRVSLTDNKSFTLLVSCFHDGVGAFALLSHHKSLPEDTLYIVEEHLKAVGFQERFFWRHNNFIDCASVKKNESPVPASTS